MELYQRQAINDYSFWNNFNSSSELLPKTHQELMPGIKWGCYGTLYTPAYWKIQYLLHNENDDFQINYRLGNSILEEVIACLLGGFGMKSEIGLAAFDRLIERNQIKKGVSFDTINASLKEPFLINNKSVHYRFPNQKAKFISQFLNRNDLDSIPFHNDLEFRDWLMTVNGIGAKTASWITRNYLDSENVAIVDIHIYRVGLIAGLFTEHLDIQKDYFEIESRFIDFCKAMDVSPSKMDALMWLQMKASNRTVLKVINNL